MSKALPPFTPDERQCLILGNYDYAPLQYMGVDQDGNPKQLGFADLHHVEPDLQLFREKIVQYGFDDLDVVTKINLNVTQVKDTFK